MTMTQRAPALLLLSAFLLCSAAAMASPPRGSTQRELEIGSEVVKEIEGAVKFVKDPEEEARLEGICGQFAARTERPLVDYCVKIIEAPVANAFIIPGGFIYVTSKLLEEVRSDDELAGVMAHEIAHNVAQHSLRRMDRGTTKVLKLAELLSLGIFIFTGGGEWGQAAQLGVGALTQSIMSDYSIEDEKEADRLGLDYMIGSDYDPVGFLTFLEQEATLRNQFLEESMGFFRTHPFSGDRVLRARRFLEGRGVPIKRRLVNGAPGPLFGMAREDDGREVAAVIYEEVPLYFLGDPDSISTALAHNLQAIRRLMDQEVPAKGLRVEETPDGGAALAPEAGAGGQAGGATEAMRITLTAADARANDTDALSLAALLRDRIEAVRKRDTRQVAVLYYLIGGMQE